MLGVLLPLSRRRRGVALFAICGMCCVGVYVTSSYWSDMVRNALICADEGGGGETMVLDSLDLGYDLFKEAASIQSNGTAAQVFVPLVVSGDAESDMVAREVATTFARMARLARWEFILVPEVEPISLNAAHGVRERLQRDGIVSVTVLSPAYRSRRTELIYRRVLDGRGILLRCRPSVGRNETRSWTETWHGIQEIVLQFTKLQYYRFWVLPFLAG
jgi:hypothetical protein